MSRKNQREATLRKFEVAISMNLLESIISRDQELVCRGRWLHGANNDSLVVDCERQIFFWNSRGVVGDIYTWLTEIKGMSYSEAKDYLKTLGTFTGSFIHNISDKAEVIVYPALIDVFYENGLHESTEYWDKRGINDTTRSRFKLGYYNGFYTIPVFQDGIFRNFQLRQDEPTKKILYYYENTGRLLFNSDILKLTDTIIITEGPTDCLRLSQEGAPCMSHTAGSEGWDTNWFKYFIHQKKVIVLYDNDDAGRNGAIKVAKNLGEHRTWIYTFDGFGPKYDAGDFFNAGYKLKDLRELIEKGSKRVYEL
jgi:DNA primase